LPQEAKEDMAKAPEETGAAQVEMPAPSLPDADRQEELSKRFDIRELSEEMRPDPIARANALLKEGKPFTLFQDLMPGSRWAMIEKEEFHYLIGVTEEERPRLLYGIPGTLSCPPDEGTLWTFFPTEEGGEQGYYLTERKELDR